MEIRIAIEGKSLEQLNKLLGAPQRMNAAYDAATEQTARYLAQTIRDGIRYQHFHFAPLAPSTVARKRDKRILYETGKYVRSIRPVRRGGKQWGIEMDARLNRLHEQGTSQMPARPHIAQGIRVLQANKRMLTNIAEVFRDALLGTPSKLVMKGRGLR